MKLVLIFPPLQTPRMGCQQPPILGNIVCFLVRRSRPCLNLVNLLKMRFIEIGGRRRRKFALAVQASSILGSTDQKRNPGIRKRRRNLKKEVNITYEFSYHFWCSDRGESQDIIAGLKHSQQNWPQMRIVGYWEGIKGSSCIFKTQEKHLEEELVTTLQWSPNECCLGFPLM